MLTYTHSLLICLSNYCQKWTLVRPCQTGLNSGPQLCNGIKVGSQSQFDKLIISCPESVSSTHSADEMKKKNQPKFDVSLYFPALQYIH